MKPTIVCLVLACAILTQAEPKPSGHKGDSTKAILQARDLAYTANFRNDQLGMKKAIAEFDHISADPKQADLRPYALYYEGWTQWSLAASYVQANDQPAAIHALEESVRLARLAADLRKDDAEFQCMLTNTLISLMVVDRSQFASHVDEVREARKKSLALGPNSPRVVMMEAGMIFNAPPERGGDQEKGIKRWLDAISLFEDEAKHSQPNSLAPDWGLALAYGWLGNLYMNMKPPHQAEAKEAATTALKLRPDFWYVSEVLMKKISDQ